MKQNRKKIAFVNILFPPKAFGGATRIVVDEIAVLKKTYADEFEIVVFTADLECSPTYTISVYPHDGYRVYSIACEWSTYSNWNGYDGKVAKAFDEFLAFERPDLIHFHCIQVLTGSIVEAAQNRNIPHFITVHDGWWLSDYQFLTDEFSNVYPDAHPDPFEEYAVPAGVTIAQSIRRRSYLKRLLAQSDGVLAVSETFRRIYQKNGVANIITNRNGISDQIEWRPKSTRHCEKVICAHIGGASPHKGYDIFQRAIFALNASHIEVLIVDHTQPEDFSTSTHWGKIAVTIIGRVNQEHIGRLYERIDVLFAPSVCPESFGLVTREAAACGCWVVASDIGGIGDDVTDDNGFRIAPTEQRLLEVLKEIDKSPEKFKGLSRSKNIRYASEQVKELVDVFRHIFSDNLSAVR